MKDMNGIKVKLTAKERTYETKNMSVVVAYRDSTEGTFAVDVAPEAEVSVAGSVVESSDCYELAKFFNKLGDKLFKKAFVENRKVNTFDE